MLRLYRISGHSLTPEFKPGDFVLVGKIPFFQFHPKTGETIAFKHPAYGLLIKRVSSYDPTSQQVSVQGTHPDSIDSRNFGLIPIHQVIGKVIWHIHQGK